MKKITLLLSSLFFFSLAARYPFGDFERLV